MGAAVSFDRRELPWVVRRFLLVKLLVLAAAVAGFWLPFGQGLREENFVYRQPDPASLGDRFAPFDGQWYLQIAEQGYQAQPLFADQRNLNFFPLYPALLAVLAPLTGGARNAGLVVTAAASFAVVLLLYLLVRRDFPRGVAQRTVGYLLLFPTAVVLSAVYSEALFLALAVGALLCGRSRHYALAVLLGVLAALTRSVGVLVAVPLVVQYAAANGFRLAAWGRALLVYAAIPLATLAYLGYVGVIHGAWDAYGEVVAQGWEIRLAWPGAALLEWRPRQLLGYRNGLVDWFSGAAFLLLLLPIARRLPPAYASWSLAFTLLPLSVGSTMSLTRYLMVSWPHFLYLAQAPQLEPALRHRLLAASLAGMLVAFTIRFTTWSWIG